MTPQPGPAPQSVPLWWAAACELVLTTVLLFSAVSVVRWLRDPASPLYVEDLGAALLVIGAITAVSITGLILSPLGRRSGGHLNPAVSVGLWLMEVVPGRVVAPYAVAQLAGSVAGTALARLAWGRATGARAIGYGAIAPAPNWGGSSVFIAEVGAMLAVMVMVGQASARSVPFVIGLAVGAVIATLGSRSGGSINPARQLGPALLSGRTSCLAIYLPSWALRWARQSTRCSFAEAGNCIGAAHVEQRKVLFDE